MAWVWIVQITDVVKCKEIISSIITLQVENSNKKLFNCSQTKECFDNFRRFINVKNIIQRA